VGGLLQFSNSSESLLGFFHALHTVWYQLDVSKEAMARLDRSGQCLGGKDGTWELQVELSTVRPATVTSLVQHTFAFVVGMGHLSRVHNDRCRCLNFKRGGPQRSPEGPRGSPRTLSTAMGDQAVMMELCNAGRGSADTPCAKHLMKHANRLPRHNILMHLCCLPLCCLPLRSSCAVQCDMQAGLPPGWGWPASSAAAREGHH
jgi:hypothetical protein